MKMKYIYTALFVAGVFVSSCDKVDNPVEMQSLSAETQPSSNLSTTISKTFGSILDEEAATTRSVIATVDGKKRFRWNGGDQINVFDNLGVNNQFTAGGDAGTEYTAPSFSGTVGEGANTFFALYPYDADATWTFGTTTASAYVPSYQGWLTETNGNAARASKFHLLGATESAGTLQFKNLTSIIHIKPSTGLSLYEIKIEMGGTGTIAGDCSANLSTRTVGSGSSNTVLIQKSNGLNGGKDYYFVVLPTTERNINVTFIKTNGTYQTVSKTLSNASGIVAGKMIDFGEVTSSNLTSFTAFNYTKVTSAPTDWTGEYTFVNFQGGNDTDAQYVTLGANYIATKNDAGNYYTNAGVTDGAITASRVFSNTNGNNHDSNAHCNITVVKSKDGSGYYVMQQGKYLTCSNSNSPNFEDSPTAGSVWNFVFDDTNDTVHLTTAAFSSRKFGSGPTSGTNNNRWVTMASAVDFTIYKADH